MLACTRQGEAAADGSMPLRHVRLFLLKALAGPPADRTMQPIYAYVCCTYILPCLYIHTRRNGHVRLFLLKALAGPPTDRTAQASSQHAALNATVALAPQRQCAPARRCGVPSASNRAGGDTPIGRSTGPAGIAHARKARTGCRVKAKPGRVWVTKPGRVLLHGRFGSAGSLSYTDEGYGAAQQLALTLIVEIAKAVDPAVTNAFR